jgi:peptide/nickel transport system ATP-binding protein
MHPIIRFKNVAISFQRNGTLSHALKSVSWQLMPGQVCGIVGESGSGKSISSLALMGLLPAEAKISGHIEFHDGNQLYDITSLSEEQQRALRGKSIAMIFQEPMTSLNPVMTCGAQVMESILLHEEISHAEAEARCIALFEEVQLPRPELIMKSYPHELSGGQKQRVMIAMAISSNPQVLIADEPTTALDVTVQKSIIALLRRIKDDRKMSMLFISHDLALVSEIADEVIVMQQGEIVEQAKASQIFTNAQEPYTKSLLACRPTLDFQLKSLPVVKDFLQNAHENPALVFERLNRSVSDVQARSSYLEQQPSLLELQNIEKYYPLKRNWLGKVSASYHALRDISLSIKKSETLGLVGESGCGKSTLGRTLLQLIRADAGKIFFEGRDITHVSNDELRKLRSEMQIIFQDPYSSLNPKLRIGDALLEVMKVHQIYDSVKQRKEFAAEIMEKVGLSAEQLNRFPSEFSGGQRQRVSIARALIMKPKLIVCDESVSALDVSVQAQVLNLLSDLREEFQLTYLFISHDLSVVKHISDRIAVMEKGSIVELQETQSLFANPQHPYTQKLIEAIPRLKAS